MTAAANGTAKRSAVFVSSSELTNPLRYGLAQSPGGIPGKNMGLAFKGPSHGSDRAFIRDLDGSFHVIYEDWSPIDASARFWD